MLLRIECACAALHIAKVFMRTVERKATCHAAVLCEKEILKKCERAKRLRCVHACWSNRRSRLAQRGSDVACRPEKGHLAHRAKSVLRTGATEVVTVTDRSSASGLSAPRWRPRFTKTWFCSNAFLLTTNSMTTSKRSVATPRLLQLTHCLATISDKSACLQIHFSNIICLTGLKIGAAPGTGSLTDVPHVHVFALDLHTLSGSRYACAAEHCTLPDSGTRSVRVEVSLILSALFHNQLCNLSHSAAATCSAASFHQEAHVARAVSNTPAGCIRMGHAC